MTEVFTIFAHLAGGVLALIGLISIMAIIYDIKFDWDDYDLPTDEEEH